MIWCVEDDPSIRELETYVLNTTGLEACGFEDGQIFIETVRNVGYRLEGRHDKLDLPVNGFRCGCGAALQLGVIMGDIA